MANWQPLSSAGNQNQAAFNAGAAGISGHHRRLIMRTFSTLHFVSGMLAVLFAVSGGLALAQQDRYTLKLGELSFSDFRGYENWQNIAVSQTETMLKVIVANDVMMQAYRQGLPADGKLFPEGSKIAKIEWTFKRSTVSPYFVNVPDTLVAVATIEKRHQKIPGHARMGLRQFQL
jgi:hypothetical protein